LHRSLRRSVRLCWVPALALALALGFLATDSGHRLRAISAVTSLRLGDTPVPAIDPTSPTGFEAGQHRLILPTAGTDGYHWILQTERILAGEGLRIRRTTVDNAPHGREVHWSSLPRWWLAAVARARSVLDPGLSPALALEEVAAGAGALALAFLLLVGTPLLARRFGPVPASLFALSWVAVFPLYETFMAGIVDHHGFLAMSGFAGVIFLVAGGAGWVRDGTSGGARGLPVPDERSARRCFVAAGIVSGIGMWVSAATTIPLLAATTVGAVLAAGAPFGAGSLLGSGAEIDGVRPAPGLWRVWGAAGCATALVAYALEYAPQHLGVRLEVNHPLHALAWLAGGDLLARASWAVSRPFGLPPGPEAGQRRRWPWLAGSLLLASVPGVLVLTSSGRVFQLADPFLRGLHLQYIREFQGLGTHLAGLSGLQVIQSVSALPLVLLPAAAVVLLARGKGLRGRAWQLLGLCMVLAGVAFLHAATFASMRPLLAAAQVLPLDPVQATVAAHLAGLVLDVAAVALLFLWPLRRALLLQPADLARIALAAVPATALLVLTFWQVRWLAMASAALLALLVTAAAMGRAGSHAGERLRRVVPAGLVLLVLAPFPLMTALFPWRLGYPGTDEAPQVVARDVAHRLRSRVGQGEVVLAGPPVTTTWMIYFGGFRGLGTLYWENAEGLRATAALASAPDEAGAREEMERHGVTHLLVPSWEAFPSATGPVLPTAGTAGESLGAPPGPARSFLARTFASGSLPSWLVPIPYELPDTPALRNTTVRLYEVRTGGREEGSGGRRPSFP